MSASITLMGRFPASYSIQFKLWLNMQGLDGAFTSLTTSDEVTSVVRIELEKSVPEDELDHFCTALLTLSDDTNIDHIYQAITPDINKVGVAVFDMDSTLIKVEVMDELAVEFGIGEKISAVTAKAMLGEIDFVESFVQRLSLLNGLSIDVMDNVYQRIVHMDGIVPLMKVLHHFGWYTAILSSGFTYFADRVQLQYDMNEVHANVLEIRSGSLTGRYVGGIVDSHRKEYLLEMITNKIGCGWSQTLACGDGANDLLMLNRAALGVAFHAKFLVRKQAPCSMNASGLDGILYLFGLSSTQIQDIVGK